MQPSNRVSFGGIPAAAFGTSTPHDMHTPLPNYGSGTAMPDSSTLHTVPSIPTSTTTGLPPAPFITPASSTHWSLSTPGMMGAPCQNHTLRKIDMMFVGVDAFNKDLADLLRDSIREPTSTSTITGAKALLESLRLQNATLAEGLTPLVVEYLSRPLQSPFTSTLYQSLPPTASTVNQQPYDQGRHSLDAGIFEDDMAALELLDSPLATSSLSVFQDDPPTVCLSGQVRLSNILSIHALQRADTCCHLLINRLQKCQPGTLVHQLLWAVLHLKSTLPALHEAL